jgi:hypothetical protein
VSGHLWFDYGRIKWLVPWERGWAVAAYWLVSRAEDVLYGIARYLSISRAWLLGYMGVQLRGGIGN